MENTPASASVPDSGNAATTPPPANRRSNLRRRWWIGGAIVFLSLFGAVYFILTTRPALYSSPNTTRPSITYESYLNPPKPTPISAASTNPPNFFLKVATNQSTVRVEFMEPQRLPSVIAYQGNLLRATGGETVTAGSVNFRLKRIAHAWVQPNATNSTARTQNNIPANFYSPDGQPLAEADILRDLPQPWQRQVNVRDNRNTYRFDFEFKNGPWRILNFSLHDGRTWHALSSGSSSRSTPDRYSVELQPLVWHQGPVDLLLHIATGPLDVEEIEARPGNHFSLGAARYHLLYAGNDLSTDNISSSHSGQTWQIDFAPPPADQIGKSSLFLFYPHPKEAFSTFFLEYIGAEGKKLRAGAYNRPDRWMAEGAEASLHDIKKIRISKYTRDHRVILRLPKLPGLPPQNEQVNNLFRVQAPVLRFQYEREQTEYVRGITQLDLVHSKRLAPAPSAYPRSFTNATAIQILEDYAWQQNVPGEFYVDEENLTLRIGQRTWQEEMKERAENIWKKLRR